MYNFRLKDKEFIIKDYIENKFFYFTEENFEAFKKWFIKNRCGCNIDNYYYYADVIINKDSTTLLTLYRGYELFMNEVYNKYPVDYNYRKSVY